MSDNAEAMLADIFEGRWPAERNCYALNVALRCVPWWPPLPVVWERRFTGPPTDWGQTLCWSEALALLHDLHAEYVAAKGAP